MRSRSITASFLEPYLLQNFVEQLADLAPEDLENIPGIGAKTVEKIKDVLSEYYAQLPSYQDDLVRQAAEHMFSKSADEPEQTEETAKVEAEQSAPEEQKG